LQLDDWKYNEEKRMFINRWDKRITIDRDRFMRLPIAVRTGTDKQINETLNTIGRKILQDIKRGGKRES
jgi:hypothetical protein